jgi:hypothetical protein
MKLNLRSGSLLLFGLSVVLWIVLTLFESALVGISLMTERVITFLALVLPAALGAALGMLSLVRRDRRIWLAVAGVMLNGLFALFHLLILAFAG